MRQIFTSQRLETVEGVAKLLEDAGIPVHISQPRSYRSHRRGQFSYAEPVATKHQPAVWIRKPEDQPRARELLRQAGLLVSTRTYADVPTPATEPPPSPFEEQRGGRWAWRVRIGLLLVIAAVALFIWLGRPSKPAAPAATPPAPAAAPGTVPGTAPATEADKEKGEDGEIRVRVSPPPPPAG